MFEAVLNGETDNYSGHETNDHGAKTTDNRRNGYSKKTIHTSRGDVEINNPEDRNGSFDPQVISKRSRDISAIEKDFGLMKQSAKASGCRFLTR